MKKDKIIRIFDAILFTLFMLFLASSCVLIIDGKVPDLIKKEDS